jgi:hypothetical protein
VLALARFALMFAALIAVPAVPVEGADTVSVGDAFVGVTVVDVVELSHAWKCAVSVKV